MYYTIYAVKNKGADQTARISHDVAQMQVYSRFLRKEIMYIVPAAKASTPDATQSPNPTDRP